MDSTNLNFTINCESNPALYKKCQVLWMETWSEDSMKKVSCINCDLFKLVSLNITELWWIRLSYLKLWRSNYRCTYLVHLYTLKKTENSAEQLSIISIAILPVTLCFVQFCSLCGLTWTTCWLLWIWSNTAFKDKIQTTNKMLKPIVLGLCGEVLVWELACRGDFCERLPEASPMSGGVSASWLQEGCPSVQGWTP